MLQLRPNCENCNKPLPPASTEAMICSFECTFCQSCVDTVLNNVCPNCGGGFAYRPVRPAKNWKDGNYLGECPASTKVIYKPVDAVLHDDFIKNIKNIDPDER